jgi:hypothetical protein
MQGGAVESSESTRVIQHGDISHSSEAYMLDVDESHMTAQGGINLYD